MTRKTEHSTSLLQVINQFFSCHLVYIALSILLSMKHFVCSVFPYKVLEAVGVCEYSKYHLSDPCSGCIAVRIVHILCNTT